MVTFKVPANKVAELGGNTEKIKGICVFTNEYTINKRVALPLFYYLK